jgi:two-component system response regulator AtoC
LPKAQAKTMLNAVQQGLEHRFSSAAGASAVSPASVARQAGPAAQDEHDDFVCVSASLRRLLLQAEITGSRLRLASLEGEPGSGKHLLAETIHARSPLARLPFLRRDAREWLAMEADVASLTGTLYLDRVDLLGSGGQNLLLHLLKLLQNLEKTQAAPRFLLLVSAHNSLRQLASQGLFLPDLAFRLTAVRFAVPALRDHREDIAPIAQALIDRICRRYKIPTAVLAPGALPRLLQHSWPGNVRELASVIEAAILESPTGILHPSDLQMQQTSARPDKLQDPPPAPDDLTLQTAILSHIQLVLKFNHGNKLRSARQLGISRSTLYRIMSGQDFPIG